MARMGDGERLARSMIGSLPGAHGDMIPIACISPTPGTAMRAIGIMSA
jgi:hypothetical protein